MWSEETIVPSDWIKTASTPSRELISAMPSSAPRRNVAVERASQSVPLSAMMVVLTTSDSDGAPVYGSRM